MIKNIIFFFVLTLAVTAIGCSSGSEETAFKFGVGKYKFTMWDSTGIRIAEGTLNVKSKTGNDIGGTYEFTKIYQKDFDGLSVMNGEFGGNIIPAEKKVFINTNPKIADANVFWNMVIKKSSMSGDWTYSLFRGTGNKGRVRITK